jgi:hypothetical protein
MAEKIAPGVWLESPPSKPTKPEPDRQEIERLTTRRDNARWSAVVGFVMLFAAGFSTAFAIGGVLMIGYGTVASMYWSRRITKLKGDPWAYDPELDGPQGLG